MPSSRKVHHSPLEPNSIVISSNNHLDHSTANNPEHLPSPHHYTPQKANKNQVKIVFTKSLRKTFLDQDLEKSPGPGQYETNISKDYSYSSSSKEVKNRTFTSRFGEKS